MKRRIVVVFFVFWNLHSQEITIKDFDTKAPIEGVKVMVSEIENVKKISKTNQFGVIFLKKIKSSSNIEIHHEGYHSLSIPYNEIIDKLIFLKRKLEDLESVVLSVSRVEEEKQKIPEQTGIATRERIASISPQTSSDILKNIAGVRVQKSQWGGGSPVIRGMEANRILFVVDGVRMNNAIYRTGHIHNLITVSPFGLDRVEVLFGPASVIYGSDALGGVVHYYTRKLKYSPIPSWKNEVFYRYSHVNNENTGSFISEIFRKKWSAITSISYSSFGDLKMGKSRFHGHRDWGKVYEYSLNSKDVYHLKASINPNSDIQKNTGYRNFDLLQKFMFPLHQKVDLTLNAQFSRSSDVPNFGKLNDLKNKKLKFAEWYYGPEQRVLLSAQAKFDGLISLFKSGMVTMAYQNILESRINRNFGSLKRSSRFENVSVYSLNGDFFMPISPRDRLFYGGEWIHNQVKSTGKGEVLSVSGNQVIGISEYFPIAYRYPNAGSTYSGASCYASYRKILNERHSLSMGLRLTSTWLRSHWKEIRSMTFPDGGSSLNLTLKNTTQTGSLGYVFNPSPGDKMSVFFSKGFRFPNVDDIGKIRAKSGKLTVPNMKLNPEKLWGVEMGIFKNFFSKRLQIQGNVYYTILHDYITRSPSKEFGKVILYDGDIYTGENILANTNFGKANIYGSFFDVNVFFLNSFKSNVGLTYTKGFLIKDKMPLSSIPPIFGNVSLVFYDRLLEISLDYCFSIAKNIKDYNLIEGKDNIDETPDKSGIPAWNTLNSSIDYRWNKNFKIKWQLHNIFDVHYKEFASSISAPGRNISVALSYCF